MTKKEAKHFRKLTHFPTLEKSMFRKFIVQKFDAFRREVEKALADTSDVFFMALDAIIHFVFKAAWAFKTIGAVTLLALILLTLVLSGCATGYFTHVWCKSKTQDVSFGVYTQDDGKLKVKVYNMEYCTYLKDQNVVIEDENKAVK